MVNYKDGKIYKLVDLSTKKVYFGSTCCSLTSRKAKHKQYYKGFINENNNQKYISSIEIVKNNCFIIVLVENFSCTSKIELEEREKYYILNFDCVNKNIPRRTIQEYQKDKKNKIKEYKKKYYKNNINKIKDYKKKYDCENFNKNKEYRIKNKDKIKISQKQYYEENKEKIQKTNKKWRDNNRDKVNICNKKSYHKNKDKINEKRKNNRIKCDCGSEVRKDGFKKHLKSKKHLKYLNNFSIKK